MTAWKYGACTGGLRGPSNVIFGVIGRLGVPWMWSPGHAHFLVPIQCMDDVAAALELDGHTVEIGLPGW